MAVTLTMARPSLSISQDVLQANVDRANAIDVLANLYPATYRRYVIQQDKVKTSSRKAPVIRIEQPDGTSFAVLSNPAKMPCYSFSLPAGGACPYAVSTPLTLPDGTVKPAICDSCYAAKGAYGWKSTQNSQAARYAWVRDCLKNRPDTLVAWLVAAIMREGLPYFRIHDSGDMFSPAYVEIWYRVARALPEVKFWAPTRSWQASWVSALVELNSLANVTVRPSGLYQDMPAPSIPGLAAGTTVVGHASDAGSVGADLCRAYGQGGQCLDCRACWGATEVVAYPLH